MRLNMPLCTSYFFHFINNLNSLRPSVVVVTCLSGTDKWKYRQTDKRSPVLFITPKTVHWSACFAFENLISGYWHVGLTEEAKLAPALFCRLTFVDGLIADGMNGVPWWHYDLCTKERTESNTLWSLPVAELHNSGVLVLTVHACQSWNTVNTAANWVRYGTCKYVYMFANIQGWYTGDGLRTSLKLSRCTTNLSHCHHHPVW